MSLIRLDRFLSDAGFGTRKHVKKIIRSLHVSLDGNMIDEPDFLFDPLKSAVKVDERKVDYSGEIFILMNKPEGYICSAVDELYPSVMNIVPPSCRKRVKIVGRLDVDTTGVLLLTDNGRLNNRLIHPNLGIEKEYEATLNRPFREADLTKLNSQAIDIGRGQAVRPARAVLSAPDKCLVTLTEGKYHEVKRIFGTLGYDVIALKRIRLGFLTCGRLAPGECRRLEDGEIDELKKLTHLERTADK